MAGDKQSYMGMRGPSLHIAMAILVVAPSFMCYGYNNGATGGISSLPDFLGTFPILGKDATIMGTVVGTYDLGAVVGSLCTIAYSNKIGRLRTSMLAHVLAMIGLAIQASAYSLAQFIIGRLIVGMAMGTISSNVPVWQAECAGAAHRGAFVVVTGLCIASGIAISEWVELGFSYLPSGPLQWRIPLAFPAVFCFITLPVLFFMPESPRWLHRERRTEESRQVLAVLEDKDPFSIEIDAELSSWEHPSESERTKRSSSMIQCILQGKDHVLHRTLLACSAQMFQQLCGISALVFYTKTLFNDLGIKGEESSVLSAALTTVQAVCSIIPFFTIDRFGRRKNFLFTGSGLTICMAVLAGTSGHSENKASNTVAIVSLFMFNFFFPIGFLGQPFVYAAEIAPTQFRIPVTALANATHWICQFVVAQITPEGTKNLGQFFWIIFAGLNLWFTSLVFLFFPETQRCNLEDVDAFFEDGQVFFFRDTANRRLAREQAANWDVKDMGKVDQVDHVA